MTDARTVIARAVDTTLLPDEQADRVLSALAAARLAVVPVPEDSVVEAAVAAGNADTLFQVWAEMLGMRTEVIAGRAAQALVPIIAAAEREACAKICSDRGIRLATGEDHDSDPNSRSEEAHCLANAIRKAAAIRAGGRP